MADKNTKRDDSKKLTEIRENFRRYRDYWRPIYEDGKKDMDCLTPGVGPWDPQERESRKENGRQCLTLDELHQYVNQLINDVRMNKIGIKVDPKGAGATSLTASTRQGIIRNIEFESNAQTAYTTAFEGAAQRGYGFAKVITEFASPDSWDQVIKIVRIPNPDTVLMDPNCVEATCSDAEGTFVFTVMRKPDFKRKYPWAQKTSFTTDDQKFAPDWFPGDDIIVAEWWEIEKTYRTLLCLPAEAIGLLPEGKEPPQLESVMVDGEKKEAVSLYEDELPKNHGFQPYKSRKCEERKLVQYITNGVELLETNPQAGKYIRIIPCFGKEMFVTETGGSKRKYLSLIRLARDAFMYYCFLRTQQAEEAQMTPKVPWVGYEGQFSGHEDDWALAHRVPIGFLQAKAILDATGQAVLPLPNRPQFTPNFLAYEAACESAKRAIQSSMGMFNASVGKHDSSVKSGKQQDALERESSQGNFHFIDNYHRFIQQVGVVVDDLLKPILDTPGREIGMREPDDSLKMITLNKADYVPEGEKEPVHYDTQKGNHDVNVSTGPSFESQRDEFKDFLNTLVGSIKNWPVQPQQALELLSLAIRMNNFGPMGDQMADMLSPKDKQQELPPEVMQAMQQLKQETQGLNEYCKKLEAEKQQLEMEKAAKVMDNSFKMEVEKLKAETEITRAEISTKAQVMTERMTFIADMLQKLHDSSHELAMQKDAQAHGAITQAADHEHTADMAREAQAAQAAQEQSPAGA